MARIQVECELVAGYSDVLKEPLQLAEGLDCIERCVHSAIARVRMPDQGS